MHLGNIAAEAPVKFQGNTIIKSTNLAASRCHEILQYDVLSDIGMGPWFRYQIFQKN